MPSKPPVAGTRRSSKAWDHGGKSRHERGYGSKWVRLRNRVLARDKYLCQPCLRASPQRITAAREVDHVVPKAKGGTDDPSNLEAICVPCHRDKSARDQGKVLRIRRRATSVDGWLQED